tara:strand:- start:227 stop:457 length:231 start_codon:yes stop_codon:yes gene_type:complete
MEIKKEKKLNKSLKSLPKLKQDIVKSMTQTSLNKKYGDLVENIIERKLNDKNVYREGIKSVEGSDGEVGKTDSGRS